MALLKHGTLDILIPVFRQIEHVITVMSHTVIHANMNLVELETEHEPGGTGNLIRSGQGALSPQVDAPFSTFPCLADSRRERTHAGYKSMASICLPNIWAVSPKLHHIRPERPLSLNLWRK
jgi:hypothetical protein